MSRKSSRMPTIASRLGSARWPRWLVRLHSVYVATTASVMSGSASFRRMSVAMACSLSSQGESLPIVPADPRAVKQEGTTSSSEEVGGKMKSRGGFVESDRPRKREPNHWAGHARKMGERTVPETEHVTLRRFLHPLQLPIVSAVQASTS